MIVKMKLKKVTFLFLILQTYFTFTSGWGRRRRRRCDSSSCSWVWGQCSRTCGGGIQFPHITRNRGSCGPPCHLPSSRSCNYHFCPVDCQWEKWGNWGSCSATCGGGSSIRNRNFLRREAYGGRSCSGPSSESRPCSTGCCPVDCQWGAWENWESCSTTCGSGVRTKKRFLLTMNSCGGSSCLGSNAEEGKCNIGPCPVNCQWETWSRWNGCSVSCGGGEQSRFREIRTQAQHGGKECDGPDLESRACNDVCCPVDCSWDRWGPWGGCSQTCAGGLQLRQRSVNISSSCGGASCDGDSVESKECNDVCCPINCSLSSWSEWGSCSATCGSGTRNRSRVITQTPKCGGIPCKENLAEKGDCNSQCCPVDCLLGEWQNWAACSSVCGANGTTIRRRLVDFPATCGGLCLGHLNETQACNRICFHGGKINGSTCECGPGWEGECCEIDE